MPPLQLYAKMIKRIEDMEDIEQANAIQNQIRAGVMQTYPSSVVENSLNWFYSFSKVEYISSNLCLKFVM